MESNILLRRIRRKLPVFRVPIPNTLQPYFFLLLCVVIIRIALNINGTIKAPNFVNSILQHFTADDSGLAAFQCKHEEGYNAGFKESFNIEISDSIFNVDKFKDVDPERGFQCLQIHRPFFLLNGKKIQIISGAVHYFRIHPKYWKQTLLKVKAAGLNTVETYVAWNLHEPKRNEFNFTGWLDIQKFLGLAKEVGLYVILRPGPYICSEWDHGGLPSWLLRDPDMKLRTTYPPFMSAVENYIRALMERISSDQCARGGAIIAIQVENEYGSFEAEKDPNYIILLTKLFREYGVTEALVTSDSVHRLADLQQNGIDLRAPFGLITANFQSDAARKLDLLEQLQPGKPHMVMEYWSGWFDHWTEKHHKVDIKIFNESVTTILTSGASINFYMFMGGTNFGFMNGANGPQYSPTVTSYDYSAPLSEAGDYTPLYWSLVSTLRDLAPPLSWCDTNDTSHSVLPTSSDQKKLLSWDCNHPHPTATPSPTPDLETDKVAYPPVWVEAQMTLYKIMSLIPKPYLGAKLVSMELLPDYNDGAGQSVGFLAYVTSIPAHTHTLSIRGRVRDRVMVILDEKHIATINWTSTQMMLTNDISPSSTSAGRKSRILTLLLENMGRVNHRSMSDERKGMHQTNVTCDGKEMDYWEHYSIDFNPHQISTLQSADDQWSYGRAVRHVLALPTLFRFTLHIPEVPADTFIDMSWWGKGVVMVNHVVLGRYWSVGPQQTLYLPAPLLKPGRNVILVFELHTASDRLVFLDHPILNKTRLYNLH